jgi:hypothetical protein
MSQKNEQTLRAEVIALQAALYRTEHQRSQIVRQLELTEAALQGVEIAKAEKAAEPPITLTE